MVRPGPPAGEDVWRREAPRVLAALVRRYDHFEDCEDAVQLALLAAAKQWPVDGVPDNPAGWLTRVAARRMVDTLRSDRARRAREERAAQLQDAPAPREHLSQTPEPSGDDTLSLLVLCAHDALSPSSQVALMLRAVGGLTTAEIAAGFFVPEATMAQRISRAKRTLREARARFVQPTARTLAGRLPAVRQAIALIYTTDHALRRPDPERSSTLSDTALELARTLHRLCPGDPENAGLLALLLLTQARRRARLTATGDLVPLDEQDRRQWDRHLVDEGIALVEHALPTGYVGSFQLQAAIAAVHADAPTAAATDWPQILALYDMLERVDPSDAVRLCRAIALAEVQGPWAGLAALDALPGKGHRVLAARGHLLLRAGRRAEARACLLAAADQTRSQPEQRYLNHLAAGLGGPSPEGPDHLPETRPGSSGSPRPTGPGR